MNREEISELLSYNPDTGDLTWNVRRGSARAGKVVNTLNSDGYIIIGINYKRYQAHRIAWLLHYGEWPEKDIDHINLNKADNRINNLRLCDDSENQCNVTKKSGNYTSTLKGVDLHKKSGLWRARIRLRGRRVELGYFKTQEAAHAAYCAAVAEYHGQFGRTT